MPEKEKYYRYLNSEKRVSPHTLTSYTNDLEQFSLYINRYYGVALLEVKTMHIRSWFAELKEGGMSSRSIHRKRSTLTSFYKFARREQWVLVDPVRQTSAPKGEKRLPQFVDEKGMRKLLDEQIPRDGKFHNERDHLLVTLLYECGIRRAELIGINEADVDFSKQQLKVVGKRNKERLIPLSKNTAEQVKEYMKIKQEKFGVKSTFLLCTDRGAKLYPAFVYRKVNSYLGMVSTLDKRSPHILRHTFATHLLNNGAQLNTVKELLGHASLSATQVYTHNTIEKLKSIHERNHPKG